MSAPYFHLGYDALEPDELLEDSIETIPSDSDDPTQVAYAGLSPFDVPDGLEVKVISPSEWIFRFAYPNSEPGEAELRQASSDNTVFVRLGRNTGKVLEVVATDAPAALSAHRLRLDLSFLPSWQAQLPGHARNTCRRNTLLIDRMLETIPDTLRQTLLKALQTPTSQR